MGTHSKVLLTGIRASSEIHLGNYLGAMKPALQRQSDFTSYLFIADYHGLTTSPKAEELKANVHAIASAWIAAGLDSSKTVLWRQSDIPEVLELAYILGCVTSMGLLERAHSYKDALAKSKNIKLGLFYYPVLMAADILLFNADLVPVGKDQLQHLEMTRDMATFFNETYGPLFKLPEAFSQESVGLVPGVDGRKMSKSYGNGIDIFADEKTLKKQIMSIQTDSKSLEEPKDPESCVVFQIFQLIASPDRIKSMRDRLSSGGYGYGDAKKELLSVVLEDYAAMRKVYQECMSSRSDVEAELRRGAEKARSTAIKMIERVRESVGI